MIFRPVLPGRPIPGWTQKRHHKADGAAEKGNNGCSERKLRHVSLHAKVEPDLEGATCPISILANAGSIGIARHPIFVGPVEANTAKLELALYAAHLRTGDSLDHILQVTVDAA